jgi:hypothetical protein
VLIINRRMRVENGLLNAFAVNFVFRESTQLRACSCNAAARVAGGPL